MPGPKDIPRADERPGSGGDGRGDRHFPATRGSLVAAAASADEGDRRRAVGGLVAVYWKPVYKYLRLRWGADLPDAEDWTQGFFAAAWEKGTFARYDPATARFRTFLRACLDAWVQNRRRDAARAKRGGGTTPLSLDFAAAEDELRRDPARLEPADPAADLDALFRREWVRSIFALAVDDLRARCAAGPEVRFRLFEAYDLEPPPEGRPTYAELAAREGIPVTQVTNHLAAARRDLRRALLARLRETTGGEAEYRAEARDLLGVDPP